MDNLITLSRTDGFIQMFAQHDKWQRRAVTFVEKFWDHRPQRSFVISPCSMAHWWSTLHDIEEDAGLFFNTFLLVNKFLSFSLGVSKLQPLSHTYPAARCPGICLLPLVAFVDGCVLNATAEWMVATETMWHTEPSRVMLWPFTDEVWWHLVPDNSNLDPDTGISASMLYQSYSDTALIDAVSELF